MRDQAWAAIGFETGDLPALPPPSPAKTSPAKPPCNLPASPSIAPPAAALDDQSVPGAGQNAQGTGNNTLLPRMAAGLASVGMGT